ncbi:MAG TPA: hypothetical protein VNF71_05065 [Acidimicrobiales bacterium]|nr:hypothetical protein [Acidimicrobiales bacterium]
MTVALAALSAVLVIGLAGMVSVQARQRRSSRARIADLERSHSALAGRLEDAGAATAALERQLACNRSGIEVAERIRLEREWSELAGPTVPLPAEWDGTLGSALAVELELIREIVGTPSTLELGAVQEGLTGFRVAMAAEFLRAAARDADEMKVLIHGCVVVWGSSPTPGAAGVSPHLDAMKARAAEGGAQVVVEPGEAEFKATLRFDPD